MYSRAQLFVPVASPPIGHLLVAQLEEPRRGHGAAEGDQLRGVQPRTSAATSVAEPASRLVADDHRAQEFLSARARAFGNGQPGRCQCGAFVRGIPDVAVVGCGGIAERGVDAGGFAHRQPGAVEPDWRFRLAALLLREVSKYPRRVDERAWRGAGERARQNHLGVLDRFRRQLAVRNVVEEASQGERAGRRRDGHSTATPLPRTSSRRDYRAHAEQSCRGQRAPQHRAPPDSVRPAQGPLPFIATLCHGVYSRPLTGENRNPNQIAPSTIAA
jgi:hypothetical protein